MGFFKKVFKGIKKVAKKIGKGIKKVVKKVGKAFGKLGIVGQIGLMFLMPHLSLSSAWGQLGSFASKGTSLLHKAVGAVYNAGNMVGNVYKTVTEAIGNGFDRASNYLKGEGFTLSEGRTSVFGKKLNTDPVVDTTTRDVTSEIVDEVKKDKSLLDKGKDYISNTIESAKETLKDPDKVGKTIGNKVLSGVGNRISYSVAGDPPVQKHLDVSPFDIGTIDTFNQGGVFNEVDFNAMNKRYQDNGSSFGAMSNLANAYVMDQYSFGDETYVNHMKQMRMGAGN